MCLFLRVLPLVSAGLFLLMFPGVHTQAEESGVEAAGAEDKPAVVRYEAFGAQGDGETDDLAAIAAAHAYANEHSMPVKARDDATYYLGGADTTAVIQTDTDFGDARFIIDDRQVERRQAWVFDIRSKHDPVKLQTSASLQKGQAEVDFDLPGPSLLVVKNADVKHFIRRGANQNAGKAKTDVLVVDAEGHVHEDTPVVWDFERITHLTAYPIDQERLAVSGGHFTTIANQDESKYTYYRRGIRIHRSNVVVDGLIHEVTGEGEQGAPYYGFIAVEDASEVMVRNAVLTGRKTYRTIGSAGREVSMGTYDITVQRSNRVTFEDCRQSNDINDRRFWGIMASNHSKNLACIRCELSRFDAHMGVFNATIRESTLGHAGINLIGGGAFRLIDSTTYGRHVVNLRRDYGSTWRGDLMIENCVFVPASGESATGSIVGGFNDGQHDFGYECSMPRRVLIDGLRIDDRSHPEGYLGPTIFGNFGQALSEAKPKPPFPYAMTEHVVLRNVETASGLPIRMSDHPSVLTSVDVKFE